MRELLLTETCAACAGTGRVLVHRFFRKTTSTGRVGKWHIACAGGIGGWWVCGCTVTSQPALGGSTEWVAELQLAVRSEPALVCRYIHGSPRLQR